MQLWGPGLTVPSKAARVTTNHAGEARSGPQSAAPWPWQAGFEPASVATIELHPRLQPTRPAGLTRPPGRQAAPKPWPHQRRGIQPPPGPTPLFRGPRAGTTPGTDSGLTGTKCCSPVEIAVRCRRKQPEDSSHPSNFSRHRRLGQNGFLGRRSRLARRSSKRSERPPFQCQAPGLTAP